jgi:hypothetical protein
MQPRETPLIVVEIDDAAPPVDAQRLDAAVAAILAQQEPPRLRLVTPDTAARQSRPGEAPANQADVGG